MFVFCQQTLKTMVDKKYEEEKEKAKEKLKKLHPSA